jgi:hypothetical protein
VDLFDLLSAIPTPTGGRGRERSAAENLVYGLAAVGFPLLLVVLVLFAGLGPHPVATLTVASALVLATYVVARMLQVALAGTLGAVITCAVSCFVWGGVAFLLAALASFYSEF